MSLSDVELQQIVDELATRLRGASVGKIRQPGADTLVIELGRERLVVAAHPRASRVHLERTRAASNGPPPAFAMLLRKRLGGLRLVDLRVLAPGERVAVLDFGEGRDRLVAELTGPHGNVFLVDGTGAIVASLKPSSSTTRSLAPGAIYQPPPPAPAGARWRGRRRFASADEAAAWYEDELARAEEGALRDRAAVALRRDVDRLQRRVYALEGDLRRIDEASSFRKLGDLLLAHAHELTGRGAASVTVPDDFEDGSPLTIPLDPSLDARQNAARFYRQHKRLAAGRKHAESRLASTRTQLDAASRRLVSIGTLPLDEVRRLAGAAPAPSVTRRRARDQEPRLPYREYTSLSGDPILVGRSAQDNDTLTFRHARGNDVWFHTRDVPGSHVVVPRRSGRELSEATFLDAATLAAHHSPLKGEAQVDVLYTQVKSLRKPRGAAPGLVYVSDSKTIRVRMQPDRLARLLAREED